MPMIKRGDRSTGKIVESADGDEKGLCPDCGRLIPVAALTEGSCCGVEAAEDTDVDEPTTDATSDEADVDPDESV